MTTVRVIVESYLRANGYDGLWSPFEECGCELRDLVPCDGDMESCEPGYKVPCPCADDPNSPDCGCMGGGYLIGPKKG